MLKKFSIIHLSDLHIRTEEDPSNQRLLKALIEDAEKLSIDNKLLIDAIAITGDIVDRGGSQQAYNKAKDYINNFMNRFSLKTEQVFVVPGNHDIPRRKVLNSFLQNSKEEEFQSLDSSREIWETFS